MARRDQQASKGALRSARIDTVERKPLEGSKGRYHEEIGDERLLNGCREAEAESRRYERGQGRARFLLQEHNWSTTWNHWWVVSIVDISSHPIEGCICQD